MAIYYKMKKKKKGYFGMPKGMKNGAYIFCAVMMIPAVIGIIKYLYVNTQSILLAFTDGEVFKDPFSLGNFRMLFMDLKDGGEVAVATINTFKYFAAGRYTTSASASRNCPVKYAPRLMLSSRRLLCSIMPR